MSGPTRFAALGGNRFYFLKVDTNHDVAGAIENNDRTSSRSP